MTAAKMKTANRVSLLLAAALAVAGLAGAAHAQPDPVTLEVVDRDTDQVLPVWRHDGRLFVAGRPGARYGLRFRNNTDRRVMAVTSVDGVNIISGETAGYDQRGYVLEPHISYDVVGWRKSQADVADFAFAPQSRSYAARTGRPVDVGVIGMAVFAEKVQSPPPPPVYEVSPQAREAPPPPHDHAARRSRTPVLPAPVMPPSMPAMVMPASPVPPPPPPPPPPPGPSAVTESIVVAAKREERLGTAHGDIEQSFMDLVPVERASSDPVFVRQIEYDTRDNLVADGVIPPDAPPVRHPRPFPQHWDTRGYVPDPPDDGR